MISVVIPTSNEAQYLPATLDAIAATGVGARHEVVVVDASSSDETSTIASAHGARVLHSVTRQRAAQMNLGAVHAQGDVLLFLHGDTLLPAQALEKIEQAMQDRRVVGGAFARRYDSDSSLLRVTCALAGVRARLCGWFLGDQGMFVRSDLFRKLGGFRDFDMFEDLDFFRRLRREGRVVTLRPPVTSAARRFQRLGPWRTIWADFVLTYRYLRGVSPNDLAAEYRLSSRSEHRRRFFTVTQPN